MPRQRVQPAAWSAHDAAVLATVEIASALVAGEPERLRPVVADFPPQIAYDETLLAVGDVDVLTYRAVGDGSYAHRSPAVVASGGRGASAALATAAASAAGNRARRRRAQADAQARWVLDDRGAIWVSTAGFYLRTPSGLFPWGWDAVRAVSVVGPAAARVDGAGQAGTVTWMLRTDWAELLFVLWALRRHPAHPQLGDGSWLPPGWQQRARERGVVPARDVTAF